MANYVFETATATDAANFTSTDRLFFESATVGTLGVVDTPATTGPLSSTAESITLTSGTHSLTFAAAPLSYASTHAGLIFVNGDELFVGTGTGEAITLTDGGHGHSTAAYGFDGNDTISGTSAANDTLYGGAGNDVITGSSSYTDSHSHFTESDYYQGGAGNDTITGGAGNDHIYGNLLSSTAGAADGDDSIHAGAGNDYVNGNAGNDLIHGDDGNDRIYGGSGNDKLFGGNNNDYLQGNKGDDSISGDSGNDTIHGGAGNDVIRGGGAFDNDIVSGDSGDDTVVGDRGWDTLSGGSGNDVFLFFQGDAANTHIADATTAAGHGLVDIVTDFTGGEDHFLFIYGAPWAVDHVYHQQTGVTFTSAAAAQTYAEQLMDAGTHAGEVAAIQVGADTYLFYSSGALNGGTSHDVTGVDAAHSIDSAIKLVGVTASTITTDDFIV